MSKRRFHTDTRVSENFSKDGLETLTGQPARKWGRYVVKELVDNSLEAAEQAAHDEPAVSVRVNIGGKGRQAYVRRAAVTDNGPGFDRDTLGKIGDVTEFGGTKRHYALPTRGTQGNALMTILGIQNLADGGPLTIHSHRRAYQFDINADTIGGAPEVSIREVQDDSPIIAVADGGMAQTAVGVEFGESGKTWAKASPILRTLFGFAALNPHVDFSVSQNGEFVTESGGGENTTERHTPTAPSGSARWFDRSAFEDRLKADMRAAPELTVGEFINEFDGLSSRQKRRDVLEQLRVNGDETLREAFSRDGELGREATVLHAAMQDQTRKKSPSNLDSTLGRVGETLREGTKAYLDHYDNGGAGLPALVGDLRDDGNDVGGWRDLTVYYRGCDAVGTNEHRLPFVFELAAVPLPPDAHTKTVNKFGINRSVAYSPPRVSVEFSGKSNGRSHRSISSAFDQEDHDFVVVSNLICPNIPFKDKGKQSFPTEPFEDVVSNVVGKAIRKYQRDLRPMLNRLEEDDSPDTPEKIPKPPRAPRGYVKSTVFDLFDSVYREATDGGDYTVTKRQLFYKMRPAFEKRAKRDGYEYKNSATPADPKPLELKDTYFTESLIPEYETEIAEQRLCHREQRGFFVEPHSNREIELSTRKVKKYDPTDALGAEFDTILFVEKRGFYELIHKEHEITKRFDIGLIQAQGYSTIAARQLIERIKAADPDVEFLTLTDLDIHGLGIAADADAPDEFSAAESFDAERIGVTVEDVEQFGLEIEQAGYNPDELSKLKTHFDKGDINQATYEFLEGGQRVEINAIPPKELGNYLKTKLKQRGIDKIRPGPEDIETPDVDSWEDTRDDAVRRAIGDYVVEQVGDDLVNAVAAADDRVPLPDENQRPTVDDDETSVWEAVCEELKDRPAESWQDVNDRVIEKRRQDAEDEQEEYIKDVHTAVRELLQQSDIVELSVAAPRD